MTAVTIRPWRDDDSIEALTALLHAAYARLAALGLNYTAVDQNAITTARRIAEGECFVATQADGALLGSIVLRGPRPDGDCARYARADTAIAGQFAVAPHAQGRGIGTRLMRLAEARARERGFAFIAVDTALAAAHLVHLYERWGYTHEETVHWAGKTDDSGIFIKRL